MNFEEIDIKTLLPQQPPFLFFDTLVSADIESCTTSFTISETTLFVEDGCLLESGIIENMAQTCASQIGFINKYLLNEEVKKGFIGAIRNLNLHSLPRVSDSLTTTLKVLADVMGMKLVNIEVHTQGIKIADCEMKISIYEG